MEELISVFSTAIFEFFTVFVKSDPFVVFALSSIFCVSVYVIFASFSGRKEK